MVSLGDFQLPVKQGVFTWFMNHTLTGTEQVKVDPINR